MVLVLSPALLESACALHQLRQLIEQLGSDAMQHAVCPVLLGTSVEQCCKAEAAVDGCAGTLHRLLRNASMVQDEQVALLPMLLGYQT